MKNREFFVHKFILQCRLGKEVYSQIFIESLMEADSEAQTVKFDGISEEKLTEWLHHIYIGDVDTVKNLTSSNRRREVTKTTTDMEVDDTDAEFARRMMALSSLDLEDPCDDSIDFSTHNSLSSISPNESRNHGNKSNKKKNKHSGKSAYVVHKEKSLSASNEPNDQKKLVHFFIC